ncbi:hypothetical protein CALCODRAFT_490461 [Calocera cornea HHB12733]|uniref:Uncharacterized protein n=1 Tax=Calocera cornea HHB12733 TaxID=1353952 RepID=A0A165JJV3_9BASI|nr:hypothetical protein CALCODRAFT_490461 [Calocera cornea HHB12733]
MPGTLGHALGKYCTQRHRAILQIALLSGTFVLCARPSELVFAALPEGTLAGCRVSQNAFKMA